MTKRQRGMGVSVLAFGTAVLSMGCSDEPGPKPESTDDVMLPAPGPDGFQIGTDIIAVPEGQEAQNCYFFEVPFDRPVLVNRVALAQNAGSHHMNVFRVKTVVNLDGAPGDVVRDGACWDSPNWADWPLLTNSQSTGVEDWVLPEGVALRLEPREKLMLQSHYVNAATQDTPTHGKVVVNFYGLPEGAAAEELGTMFATNQSIEICPGDQARTFSSTCGIDQDNDITVVAASGHFHSRGERFTMSVYDSLTGETGPDFYESTSWDEPPFARDLSVRIPAGNKIEWSCEFSVQNDDCGDPEKGCCFTFGGQVEWQEHCNAFVYYYPRGSSDRNCF